MKPLNLDPLKKNSGILLGIALLTMTWMHRQQLGTPEYPGSILVGLEYISAFGLLLLVVFYHPTHAVTALLAKDRNAVVQRLLNIIVGLFALGVSFWLDAETLFRFS